MRRLPDRDQSHAHDRAAAGYRVRPVPSSFEDDAVSAPVVAALGTSVIKACCAPIGGKSPSARLADCGVMGGVPVAMPDDDRMQCRRLAGTRTISSRTPSTKIRKTGGVGVSTAIQSAASAFRPIRKNGDVGNTSLGGDVVGV